MATVRSYVDMHDRTMDITIDIAIDAGIRFVTGGFQNPPVTFPTVIAL